MRSIPHTCVLCDGVSFRSPFQRYDHQGASAWEDAERRASAAPESRSEARAEAVRRRLQADVRRRHTPEPRLGLCTASRPLWATPCPPPARQHSAAVRDCPLGVGPHKTPPLRLPAEMQPHVFLVHGKAMRREEGAGLRIQRPDIQGNRRYALFFRDPDDGADKGLPNAVSLIRLIDR